MKKENKIDIELLKKFFNRQCTSTEKENVISWFVDEAYEQKLSFILKKYWDEIDCQQDDLNIATERILSKIHKQIESESNVITKPKNSNKIRPLKYLKYAAMIAVLISTGIVYYYGDFTNKEVSNVKLDEIKPGHEKATLILSDGTEINLEEKKEELLTSNNSIQVVNKDKVLTYKTNDIEETSNDSDKIEVKNTVYNTLKVPAGGVYQMVLADGTQVWLNSASSLKFPVEFRANEERIVELTGEGYFDVTETGNKFIVKTSKIDITVLGTEFNVSSYAEDDFFATTLVEGSVILSNEFKSVILKPNDQGVLKMNSDKISVKRVDVEIYTAWLDGKFYFEKQKLKDLLKIVGRWYDVQVVFDSKILEEKTFTGVLNKNNSLDYLLSMISKSVNIEYKLTQNNQTNKYELKVLKN